MTELVERVSDAISQGCDYALPPFLLECCARAAIAAMPGNENAAEIERLRSILRRCMGGANVVDLGNGEYIALYLEEVDEALK